MDEHDVTDPKEAWKIGRENLAAAARQSWDGLGPIFNAPLFSEESATPRPWHIKWTEVGDAPLFSERRCNEIRGAGDQAVIVETDGGSYPPEPADAELIVRAVNAFAALLAVAKAASEDGCCDTSGACEGAESHSATNDALVDLTAAHPGWREWTP